MEGVSTGGGKIFYKYRKKMRIFALAMKKIWILIAKIGGWKFILPEKGSRPELERCVFATAPHTSVADYLVGTAYLWSLGVNGRIFIKK